MPNHLRPHSQISRRPVEVLQPQHQRSFICCQRPRSPQKTKNQRDAQALLPLGRPYVVKEVTRPGSYRLCDLDGIDNPNSWHIEHLICFYP